MTQDTFNKLQKTISDKAKLAMQFAKDAAFEAVTGPPSTREKKEIECKKYAAESQAYTTAWEEIQHTCNQ